MKIYFSEYTFLSEHLLYYVIYTMYIQSKRTAELLMLIWWYWKCRIMWYLIFILFCIKYSFNILTFDYIHFILYIVFILSHKKLGKPIQECWYSLFFYLCSLKIFGLAINWENVILIDFIWYLFHKFPQLLSKSDLKKFPLHSKLLNSINKNYN